MRISIVTGPFFSIPPAPCGAVERVWYDLAREFARRGHTVHFLCRRHASLPQEERRDGVKYKLLPAMNAGPGLKGNLLRDLYYALRATMSLPKGDMLVTNTFWLPLLAPKLRPGAGRVHAHIQRVPKGQMKAYASSGIARLAAVSTAIKNFIIQEHPGAEPLVRVFPNPIDTKVFVPPSEPRRYDGELRLVYTGRIHPEKGLHLLIDALRIFHGKHPGFPLSTRIIGPHRIEDGGGGDQFFKALSGRAANIPVEFNGPIYGREQLAEELRSAHIYCYPSQAEKGEASPVAPLEAMATGLVTIVSALPQFGDYLQHRQNGLVFNHRAEDPAEELCRALETAAFEGDEAIRKISQAAAAQGARFSIADVAERYLQDFEELLQGEQTSSAATLQNA